MREGRGCKAHLVQCELPVHVVGYCIPNWPSAWKANPPNPPSAVAWGRQQGRQCHAAGWHGPQIPGCQAQRAAAKQAPAARGCRKVPEAAAAPRAEAATSAGAARGMWAQGQTPAPAGDKAHPEPAHRLGPAQTSWGEALATTSDRGGAEAPHKW